MNTERRRGPGRSEASRLAILQATANQFEKLGYDHLTMEGIAAEAKVGKQTIYRWWPSRSALIADCLVEGLIIPDWFVPADTGDLRADLTNWLTSILDFLRETGNETLLRSLVGAAAGNEDVAQRLNERLGVHSVFGDRLDSASDSAGGQLGNEAPSVIVGEALLGAVVLRSLRGGPLDSAYAERLVDTVLGAVRA